MPWVVELVPKYNKWVVALTPLLFISINYAFASATTQLTNLLNAIGKIKITFYLMIMWTTLTWVLIPFLAIKFGVNGAAVGYSLVGLSSVVAVYIAKKYVNFSISDSMIKPLMASIIMFVTLVFVRKFLDVSFYSLGILVLVGVISYSASIISMVGSSLLEDVKKSLKTIFNRN